MAHGDDEATDTWRFQTIQYDADLGIKRVLCFRGNERVAEWNCLEAELERMLSWLKTWMPNVDPVPEPPFSVYSWGSNDPRAVGYGWSTAAWDAHEGTDAPNVDMVPGPKTN